jgi:ketosteroid isomerase-like protein
MTPEATINGYYDALRAGRPLFPFFHPEDTLMKFGISESLAGYPEVKDGLQRQTATTTDWGVTSHDLRVTETPNCAWFSDQVTMTWRNTQTDNAYAYETRWTGTLRSVEDEWKFVVLHVSTPRNLSPEPP